jgi:hypothetical protein
MLSERSRVSLIALALTLLVGAWIAATPPFTAPDEASHYLRALSIANGQILGKKVPYGPLPGMTPAQKTFMDHDTRAVEVPARLSPFNELCVRPDGKGNWPPSYPNRTGSCLEATPNGNFPPLAYLLPAAALKVSRDADTGLWLTRAASALQSVTFLVLAAVLLWSGSGWSLLGLLAAITPMVLFDSSVMNSSGLGVASCLAFAAAVLRITRAPTRTPRWVWVAFGLAGAAAILTGPIGLVFVIGELALFGALIGRRGMRQLCGESGPRVRAAALTLLAAGVVALIYARLAGFSGKIGISPVLHSLSGGLDQIPPVLQGAVGNFASLTVPLPLFAYWTWWLLALVLFASALFVGELRDRLLLTAVAALAFAFPVLFWAWVDRFTGFGLQGREVLPPLMLIPLVSGEVIFRRGAGGTQKRLAPLGLSGAIVLIAVFQAYAWWISARVAAGAPGTIRFYAHARWSPPLGWWPWIAAAALGTVAMMIFAATEAFGPGRASAPGSREQSMLQDPVSSSYVASTPTLR